MSPIQTYIFGYCDDLGLVCKDLVRTWAILKKVFFIVTRIAALELNVSKTQICVLFLEQQQTIMDAIIQIDPVVPLSAFKDYVKYLGICIGPGAHLVQWQEVIKSYKETVAFLRGIDAGLISTITLYNILAASKASWIASFVAPSEELIILEKKSLQRLTRGPWQSIPYALLTNLKVIGFPCQFQSLSQNSVSARARNGMNTLLHFWDNWDLFQAILPSDERVLWPARGDWIFRSNLFQIFDAISTLQVAQFPGGVWKQALIAKHLSKGANSSDHLPLFKRRFVRYFEADVCFPWIESVFKVYSTQCKAIKA